MGTVTPPEDAVPSDRVGFRDIYNAVGGAESRIKEHISLALIPITTQINSIMARQTDHETRIRNIEEFGSTEARQALAETVALDSRVNIIEKSIDSSSAAGLERRRLGNVGDRAIILIVAVIALVISFVK